MKIVKASKNYSAQISSRMLEELENPDKRFPAPMIKNFREHASVSAISKEFDNDSLVAFIAVDDKKFLGFIVGYDNVETAMIHYITADDINIKNSLLNSFIKECHIRGITKIVADTFEFMDNNMFFKLSGFKMKKKEPIADGLYALWYELEL
jgi:hypothetical protein